MQAVTDTAAEAAPDIALIDDAGVTAVFANNANAVSVATKIAAAQGVSLDWDTDSPDLPRSVVGVGAAVLCSLHFMELGASLSRAGLDVRVLPASVLYR